MTPLPLIPLPAEVTERPGAALALPGAVTASGPASALALLRRLVTARTAGAVVVTTADEPAAALIRFDAAAANAVPESYTLDASNAGVRITAADDAGAHGAVHTLVQLLQPVTGAAADAPGWRLPDVQIADRPRFAYRGVMLDVARHFMDVETVEAYIERAAALKFNHLHLHLTDDQGWRLHIDARPELTARGSGTSVGGDPGGRYTHADYRRIIEFAAAHHMQVVPEIDLPGHTHAVSLAHPELCEQPVLSESVRETVRTFGGELPALGEPYDGMAVGFSSLKIGDAGTDAFLTDVLGELAALTPGPYLHIGGDEALGTPPERFAAFMSQVSDMVVALGKTPITWHEAGAAAGLAPGTIGQYWGFVTPTDDMDDKTRRFVAGGGQVILSPADAVYLDMKFDADHPLGLTWANGVTTLERAYDWDPADVIDGIDETDILGVEAPLWTETVRTLGDIDALAFPRIAAAAEAAWSPRHAPGRTFASFRDRVAGIQPLWARTGIVPGMRVASEHADDA